MNHFTTETFNISAEASVSVNNDEKEYARMINVVCRPILIILGELIYHC